MKVSKLRTFQLKMLHRLHLQLLTFHFPFCRICKTEIGTLNAYGHDIWYRNTNVIYFCEMQMILSTNLDLNPLSLLLGPLIKLRKSVNGENTLHVHVKQRQMFQFSEVFIGLLC